MTAAPWTARVLAALALFGAVQDVDLRAQAAVQRSRVPALEPVAHTLTDLGRPQFVLGALLGIAVFGGPPGTITARYAVLVLSATNLLVEGVRIAVNRTRPDASHRRSNSSFPSGHAANAAALAWVLSRRWPRLAIPFWILAIGVAWSRMYLNRHFLSDVLCGAAMGVACAWVIGHWLERRRVEPGGPLVPKPSGG